MINSLTASVCIRCGKQRIVVSSHKEHINGSLVVTTLTSCPDSDCQKILEAQLEKERVDREKLTESKFAQNRGRPAKVQLKASLN